MVFGFRDLAFMGAVASQAEPVLWAPAYQTNALWLVGDDSSTISTATGVSEWRDKSGNQRNFTQATGANQPPNSQDQLNGRNVLSFNGSQYLTSPAATSTWNFLHNSSWSMHVVWKAGNSNDPNAFYGLLGNATVPNEVGFYILYDDRASSSRNDRVTASVFRGVAGAGTVLNRSADNAHPANVPVIFSCISDPSNAIAANRSIMRVNNSGPIQNNITANAPSAANASLALQIGAIGNNSGPLVGYIAEIIIVPGAQTTSEQEINRGYLAHSWGLTANLPNDHPYKTVPPTL